MSNWLKRFSKSDRKRPAAPARRSSRRVIPRLEALEDRLCLDGTWQWVGGAGSDGLWSNPTGANWLHNGAAVGADQYPGMPTSTNDFVGFNGPLFNGPVTLDVPINPLGGIGFGGWTNTLTLNNNMTVTGTKGFFSLGDGSSITLGNNVHLDLLDLGSATGGASWSSGSITGGTNSALDVYGTNLLLSGSPRGLGTTLNIGKSAATGNNGAVTLANMTGNLPLTGTNNIIDVGNGGNLYLNQSITKAGTQNTVGGIVLGGGHTGTVAVQVENGGTLYRGSSPTGGIPDQVKIGGALYNVGGTVEVSLGTMLNLAGLDGAGNSYWQKTGTSALLQLDGGANINAAGTYQIDSGTVQFTAPPGSSRDELDGEGLTFGNGNPTAMTFVDMTRGTPGTVEVQGPVSLAANTTTTMNFNGTNSTADQMSVSGGALTVAGSLKLNGNQKPAEALPFFTDTGATPTINGAWASIADNLGGTDTWTVNNGPPGGTSTGWVVIS